jgi:hypothetical protein
MNESVKNRGCHAFSRQQLDFLNSISIVLFIIVDRSPNRDHKPYGYLAVSLFPSADIFFFVTINESAKHYYSFV